MLRPCCIGSLWQTNTMLLMIKCGPTDEQTYKQRGKAILLKLLEHFILSNISPFLGTTDNQFGFKAGHSTDQCTFLLKKTASYFVTHGSSVHAVFLDASKAFDRVQHMKFFETPMYASHLWCNFRKSCMQRLRVTYNLGCRALYNLPWRASVSSHQVQCKIPTFKKIHVLEFVS